VSYRYEDYKERVFTESLQVMFLKIRDNATELIAKSGAASMERLIAGCAGTNWDMLACVDRLVELGELLEVPNPHSSAGQHRIFTHFRER
jgi:hypothetical protein